MNNSKEYFKKWNARDKARKTIFPHSFSDIGITNIYWKWSIDPEQREHGPVIRIDPKKYLESSAKK